MKDFIAPMGALVCAIGIGLAAAFATANPIPPEVPTGWQVAIKYEPSITATYGTFDALAMAPRFNLALSEVRQPRDYLCEVYQRMPVKKDAAGDFTWKDQAMAKWLKMDLCAAVVGGFHPKLRAALIALGKVADEKYPGRQWSILSGFRDNKRQALATGIKARPGNSLHGNTPATKGYGDAKAVDLVGPILQLVDLIGAQFGVTRPYKGFDPNHVQLLASSSSSSKRAAKSHRAKHFAKHRHARA